MYSIFIWNPSLCLQRLKRLRSYISLSLTKLHPSGASDSQDTTELQQRAHNNQQSLTQLCIGNTNLSNTLAHISVAKATWCRIWTIHKFFGYLSTFRSGLLSLHWWGNHSQSIVSLTWQLSIDTHLASTSPSTFIQRVGMSTTRWVSELHSDNH